MLDCLASKSKDQNMSKSIWVSQHTQHATQNHIYEPRNWTKQCKNKHKAPEEDNILENKEI